jgi:hypothetical protein
MICFHFITDVNYDNPVLADVSLARRNNHLTSLTSAGEPTKGIPPFIQTRQGVKCPSRECNLVKNVMALSQTKSSNSLPIRGPVIES